MKDLQELGTIIESHSHIDYTVEIFSENARESPPSPDDYAFGQPVTMAQAVGGTEYCMVGVIYDTRVIDPDQGSVGPRLSTGDQREIFHPGIVDETSILAGVALLGYGEWESSDAGDRHLSSCTHEMPRHTVDLESVVYKLPDDQFLTFHEPGGEFQLGYYQRLISVADEFGAEVTQQIINHIRHVTGEYDRLLNVIEQNVRWQSNTDRGVIR